jgi:L-threonylcarbamoyladenylate synthase
MVKVIKYNKEYLSKIIDLFLEGNVIAFPTETVYGLGAIATNRKAIENIYKIKNRPLHNPLIAHFSSIKLIEKEAILNENAIKLAEVFWPGPLTIILKRKMQSIIASNALSGLDTIAVRIPSHEIALAILNGLELPIVAPSANPSSYLSPSNALHVEKSLGEKIKYIIDGGNTMVGLESTIIDLSSEKPTLLRHGAITEEQIKKVIGKIETKEKSCKIIAPGMLNKHYSPTCPLRIGYDNPRDNEGLLAFGNNVPSKGFVLIKNISTKGDLYEAARNLFSALHELEAYKVSSIATMPIPNIDIGKAINDKLKRASCL